MIDRLLALSAALSRVLLVVSGALVLAMTALVSLAAFMRYFVGSPFSFTEEIVALMFLAMVFCTIPISTVRREHIVVTVGVERASRPLQRILALLSTLIMLVFCVWFVVEAAASAAFSHRLGARSEQFDLLLWPWMAIMPAVMVFVAAIVILQAVQTARGLRDGTDTAPDPVTRDGL